MRTRWSECARRRPSSPRDGKRDRVREVVREVFEEVISPLIYTAALELIHDHRAAGRLICIVSSSPEEIVEPLARMLHVDRFIATRAKVVEGRYDGELDFYAYGPGKAEAISDMAAELELDLEESFAYSDSITDLPMLEAVENPVVVNPDRELKQVASTRSWRIEYFRNPVPMRSKLPRLSGQAFVTTSAAAGGLALAGACAVGFSLGRRSAKGETR